MAYTKQNFESGNPIAAQQLNKMDAQIAANENNAAQAKAKANEALSRYGGEMLGPIILASPPTEPMQAATKQYVDAVAAQGGGSSGNGGSGSNTVKKLLYSANFTDLIASAHNNLDFGFKLVADVQYEIHFDGTIYSLTCENLLQHAMLAFGNKHLANQDYPDTEEPFFIYQKDNAEQLQYLIVSTNGAHEIAIYTTIIVNDNVSDSLNGKKIIILGDSVNYGAGWDGGFTNLFAEDFPNAIVNNASVSGATLTNETIYYQLVGAFQAGFVPDYILLDGGGNDLLNEIEPGTINPDEYAGASSFSSATIVGAFERFAVNAQKHIPNAKIIFFNLYKLHPDAANIDYSTQREVWELLRQACKKYGIRYVDLWNEGNFTPYISEQFNAFMSDWIHINEAGYRRFWPLIKSALVTA